MDAETKEIAIVGEESQVPAFSMAGTDALASLGQAENVVKYMAAKCTGPKFTSNIQGRPYPKVEWWTTVGSALGLFPVEVSSTKTVDDPITYEAVVEVRHGGQVISRASAICSAAERTWAHRDEYAIKSMATTRATGKAYRLPFSFLAVMAGLEPTPAEEMPTDNGHEEAPRERPVETVRTGYGKAWESKGSGPCAACGQIIKVGDMVHYHYLDGGEKQVEHEKCQA